MRKIKRCDKRQIVYLLLAFPFLSGCIEDNAKECAILFSDENKRPLAKSVCEKAANGGDSEAQFILSQLLFAENNTEQAVSLLEKSANQNNGRALFAIGTLYEQGQHYSKDLEKALFYYSRGCKASELKACEREHSFKQQVEADRITIETANLKAEQDRKEKQLAEEQKLLEERKAFEAEKAKEQQRLAEEKKALEHQKREAEKQQLGILTSAEVRQLFSDFAKSYAQTGISGASQWVNNCYAKSANKMGCFQFDVLAHATDQYMATENKSSFTPFFSLYNVKQRMTQVEQLKQLTDTEKEQVIGRVIQSAVVDNGHLFAEFFQKELNILNGNTQDKSSLKFYDGLAAFQENGLYGFVDINGNVVIKPQFKYAGRFSRGRSAVQSTTNDKWGFIDTQGNYVVYPNFCALGAFSENDGLAGVQIGEKVNNQCVGKWGFIDTSGNWVISPIFEYAERFVKGKAKVIYNGQSGYINRYGSWVN